MRNSTLTAQPHRLFHRLHTYTQGSRWALLAGVIALGGCATSPADHPLSYAPADSLFVAANLAPLPEKAHAFERKLTAPLQTIWANWYPLLQKDIPKDEEGARLQQFIDYFGNTLNTKGLAGFGLSEDALYALYEIDLHPVLRLSLADPAAFRTLLAEIEKLTNHPLKEQALQGLTYWQVPLAKLKPDALIDRAKELDALEGLPNLENAEVLRTPPDLLIALSDKHVIFTIKKADDTTPLTQLLGLEKPARNMLEAKTLQQVNERHALQPYGTFWLETARLLPLLGIAPSNASPQEIARVSSRSLLKEPLSATCSKDITQLASHMPEWVAGISAVTENRLDYKTVFALTPALRDDLTTLLAPLPGWEATPAPVEVGVSLRVDKLAALLQKTIHAIKAQPFECEAMLPLNELAANPKTIQFLSPLYAMGNTATGMYMRLTRMEVRDEVPLPEAVLLVSSGNPHALLAYAALARPELAKLNIQPGMPLQPLALTGSAWEAMGEQAWVGLSEQAVGVALGATAVPELERLLKQTTTGNSPLVFSRYSGTLFADILQPIAETAYLDYQERAAIAMPDTTPDIQAEQASQASMKAFWDWVRLFQTVGDSTSIGPQGLEYKLHIQLN